VRRLFVGGELNMRGEQQFLSEKCGATNQRLDEARVRSSFAVSEFSVRTEFCGIATIPCARVR
jgi:hypothetical protein